MNAATRHLTLTDTPVGTLLTVARENAVTGLYMRDGKHYPDPDQCGPSAPDDPLLRQVAAQLEEYFAHDRTEFDIPVRTEGTDFQESVWAVLRTIPYGETWTYGRLAQEIGTPTASRAVGLANGRNPVSIIVPCHRVVGANGRLTGYGGGLANKELLLHLEGGESGRTLF